MRYLLLTHYVTYSHIKKKTCNTLLLNNNLVKLKKRIVYILINNNLSTGHTYPMVVLISDIATTHITIPSSQQCTGFFFGYLLLLVRLIYIWFPIFLAIYSDNYPNSALIQISEPEIQCLLKKVKTQKPLVT